MLTLLMDLLFLSAMVIGTACFVGVVLMVGMAAVSLGRTLFRSIGTVGVFHRRPSR